MPNIRVQIIDKSYKNGKYYKEKCVITETSGRKCTCKCDSKRTLENISQSMLRTVIPRGSEYVMVLRGENRGKLGRIKEVNRKQNTAIVQLSGVITKPLTLSLDDISEFYDK